MHSFFFFSACLSKYTHISFSRFTSVISNHEPKRLMSCVCTARSSSYEWIRKRERKLLRWKWKKTLIDELVRTQIGVRDMMDIVFKKRRGTSFSIFGKRKKKRKKKVFSYVCIAHLVAFNHFTRRHTWKRRALLRFFFKERKKKVFL
jgi:hypothetical protein